jgi:hypothetical protein
MAHYFDAVVVSYGQGVGVPGIPAIETCTPSARALPVQPLLDVHARLLHVTDVRDAAVDPAPF